MDSKSSVENSYSDQFMTFLCSFSNCFRRLLNCFEIFFLIFKSSADCFYSHFVSIAMLLISKAHLILSENRCFFQALKIANSADLRIN